MIMPGLSNCSFHDKYTHHCIQDNLPIKLPISNFFSSLFLLNYMFLTRSLGASRRRHNGCQRRARHDRARDQCYPWLRIPAPATFPTTTDAPSPRGPDEANGKGTERGRHGVCYFGSSIFRQCRFICGVYSSNCLVVISLSDIFQNIPVLFKNRYFIIEATPSCSLLLF